MFPDWVLLWRPKWPQLRESPDFGKLLILLFKTKNFILLMPCVMKNINRWMSPLSTIPPSPTCFLVSASPTGKISIITFLVMTQHCNQNTILIFSDTVSPSSLLLGAMLMDLKAVVRKASFFKQNVFFRFRWRGPKGSSIKKSPGWTFESLGILFALSARLCFSFWQNIKKNVWIESLIR